MPSRSRKKPANAPPRHRAEIFQNADDFVRSQLAKRGWSPDAVGHILAGRAFEVEGHTNVALAAGCDSQGGRSQDAPRNVEACLRALRTSVALAGKLAEDLSSRLGPVLSAPAQTPANVSVPPAAGVPISLTPLAAQINETTEESNRTTRLLSELLVRAEV